MDYKWLDELNPQQREAVTYGDGPLLIVAGAGTGKTRTRAYRVSYLLSEGVQPQRIMLLTFTRRAAEETLRRTTSLSAAELVKPDVTFTEMPHAGILDRIKEMWS